MPPSIPSEPPDANHLPVVLVPWFEGQRGHPVRLAASCGDALTSLQENQGVAPVVYARAAIKIVVADAGCMLDIHPVTDRKRARAAWRQLPQFVPAW
jgi:molybdenum cofactor cytidylyltransferase